MPAPLTVRQRIVTAVATRFQGILISEEYQTNLGQHVSIWRLTPFAAADLPAIDIRDKTEESKAAGSTAKHEHRLKFECYIELAEGDLTAEKARILLADVLKSIGVATDGHLGPKWSGLAFWTEPGDTKMEVGQDGKIIGGILLSFTVIYRTPAFDPYTPAN